MRIGAWVLLVAVGAVLAFATHVTASGFNIHTVGVILMVAGALGLVVTLIVFPPRRRSTTVQARTFGRDPLLSVRTLTRERWLRNAMRTKSAMGDRGCGVSLIATGFKRDSDRMSTLVRALPPDRIRA